MTEYEFDSYNEKEFCWKCGCLLKEDEEFMGLCDECVDKETIGIEGFPRKQYFDDEKEGK